MKQGRERENKTNKAGFYSNKNITPVKTKSSNSSLFPQEEWSGEDTKAVAPAALVLS